MLSELRRVNKIILREFFENAGIIEVISVETANNIAEMLKNEFPQIKIKEIQGNNIYAEMKKDERPQENEKEKSGEIRKEGERERIEKK